MTLLKEWVAHCRSLERQPETLYSGCRKIIRGVTLEFTSLDNSLQLRDCGFTTSKLRMLERNYLVPESIAAAVALWDRRCAQEKYGSVGFSTYGHYVKAGGLRNPWELASKVTGRKPRPGGTMGGGKHSRALPPGRAGDQRAEPGLKKVNRTSVMGPCIQAVVLTWIKKGHYAIDVYYRTTELYKKFPADLVFLRDVLLKPFKTKGLELDSLTCHFANITIHPMYWVTISPHLSDPVQDIKTLKNKYFRDWLIKWSARYLCEEFSRGIQKFAQALRVRKDALERLSPLQRKELQKYLRANHPGYRGDVKEENDE